MITQEELKQVAHYDPDTGVWVSLVQRGRIRIGDMLGSVKQIGPHKRRYICINYYDYLSARLAWLYVYGCWPLGHIDHKNRNSLDDRLVNLRDATVAQNAWNGPPVKGVRKHRNSWHAKIRIGNGKRLHLGAFATEQEASAAYLDAVKKYHGEFARSSAGRR